MASGSILLEKTLLLLLCLVLVNDARSAGIRTKHKSLQESFKYSLQSIEGDVRRDTVVLSFATIGSCIGFLMAKRSVTGPVDQNPDALRTRLRRSEKGQPFVQAKDGHWMLLRTSPVTPGLILLRDRIGRVFRLQALDRSQVKDLELS